MTLLSDEVPGGGVTFAFTERTGGVSAAAGRIAAAVFSGLVCALVFRARPKG